jgi:hypothetical protein
MPTRTAVAHSGTESHQKPCEDQDAAGKINPVGPGSGEKVEGDCGSSHEAGKKQQAPGALE